MATDYHGYPTPVGTAAPFVHLDIEALAEAIDKDIPVIVDNWAALQALPSLLNLKALLKSQNYRLFVHNGTTWVPQGDLIIPIFTDANISCGSGTGMNAKIASGEVQLKRFFGSFVVNTDPSGYFGITYPTPFSTVIFVMQIINGDSSTGRGDTYAVAGTPFTQNLANFYGSVTDAAGNARASTTVRINIEAWGV